MAQDKSKGFDWAVKNGDLAGVKEFIEKGGVDVNIVDANKRTPAHWAADFVCSFLCCCCNFMYINNIIWIGNNILLAVTRHCNLSGVACYLILSSQCS